MTLCTVHVHIHVHTEQYSKRVYSLHNNTHLVINAIDLTKLQILILVAFVMISSGVVLYTYSGSITIFRLNPSLIPPTSEGLLRAYDTMFAGMLLEVSFLVS